VHGLIRLGLAWFGVVWHSYGLKWVLIRTYLRHIWDPVGTYDPIVEYITPIITFTMVGWGLVSQGLVRLGLADSGPVR
jgi:hypothetical protein